MIIQTRTFGSSKKALLDLEYRTLLYFHSISCRQILQVQRKSEMRIFRGYLKFLLEHRLSQGSKDLMREKMKGGKMGKSGGWKDYLMERREK